MVGRLRAPFFMPMLPALLAVTMAAVQTAPPLVSASPRHPVAAEAFRPDSVLAPPGGPRTVLLGATSGGVAALRLSVPLDESPVEAGVGFVLRDLARARMESLARPVGARVSASRTPWGVAYAVEGAVADIEYLAYLLREAVAEPDVGGVGLTAARQALSREVSQALEAPGPRVLDLLRRRVAPGLTATQGTEATVAGLDAARVLAAWRRSHRSDRMTLVASAGVAPEVILAATRGMGVPVDAVEPPLNAPAPGGEPAGRVQTLRTWYGEARSAGAPDQPVGPVAALLVTEVLGARAVGFEAGVELWELADRWVLAVVGAAYRSDLATMRAAVSSAVADTRSGLTDEAVADAVARVRRDFLARARTPGGIVASVGRSMEASGDPLAAARYLTDLEALDRAGMDAFFGALLAAEPARAEARP